LNCFTTASHSFVLPSGLLPARV